MTTIGMTRGAGMQDKRYQVFIATSGSDMRPERINLSQILIGMGFFSWGLEQRTPLSTAFARRQIDESDYVLLLLGSQYGELSVSGVSYLHLEYLYAKSKQKPIILLLHEAPDSRAVELRESKADLIEKFNNFRQQLISENEHVFSYRTLRDLELVLRQQMPQMLERYPAMGWVRPEGTQKLLDEIEKLKHQLTKLEIDQGRRDADPVMNVQKVAMHDDFEFEYRIHAYQDGNFKELKLLRKMTWAQLLLVLGETFARSMPEEYFSKRLNDYLNETAMDEARVQMPRIHAVARAQINIRALHHIKSQMRQNEWISPYSRDERQRLLWKISPKAQKLLESRLLDSHRVSQLKSSN